MKYTYDCLKCLSELCSDILNHIVVIGLEAQRLSKEGQLFEIQERGRNIQLRCLYLENYLMKRWNEAKEDSREERNR